MIQNMHHHVRTSYSNSVASFGVQEWTILVHGVGQGNGAGPAIWATVSTPILNMLREEGFGTIFHTAISMEQICFISYTFIDDTDLCQTASQPDTLLLLQIECKKL